MTKMPISKLEIRRQIFHILFGILLVITLQKGWINSWHLFWTLVVGIVISWLSLRFRIPIIAWLLDKFERKHTRPGKGAITFFIGALLSLQLFEFDIACVAILILALGDGVSSLVGPFGKIKTQLSEKKLLEGTITGSILGGIAGSLIILPIEAFLAAATAMIFEAMEIRLNQKLLNDNVTVPLVAGTVITLLRDFNWFA
jgi:dolichol kinase